MVQPLANPTLGAAVLEIEAEVVEVAEVAEVVVVAVAVDVEEDPGNEEIQTQLASKAVPQEVAVPEKRRERINRTDPTTAPSIHPTTPTNKKQANKRTTKNDVREKRRTIPRNTTTTVAMACSPIHSQPTTTTTAIPTTTSTTI